MPGPMREFERAKDFKGSSKKLFPYLRPYMAGIVVSLIFAVLGTALTIIGPKLIRDATNSLQDSVNAGIAIDLVFINKICIVLVAMYAASFAFTFIQTYIMAGVTLKMSRKFRSAIAVKINSLPLKYFDSRSYGDVLSRVTNDVDTIALSLNQSINQIISALITFFGVLIIMFVLNWGLTLIAIISAPVSMVISLMVVKTSQKYFRMQQASLGAINGHIEEIYSGHEVVKVFNAEERERAKFDEINEKLYTSASKAQYLSGLMHPMTSLVSNMCFIVLLVVGGLLAISGQIGIGDVYAFTIYVRMFNQPIMQVAQIMNTLQSTAAAAERVFAFLEEEDLPAENITARLDPAAVKGDVEFKHVSFGYDPDRLIIRDFSAKTYAGQKVAIVGPTGAGKTTLVNLLMRFYEVNGGDITIDGISIKELSRENIHDIFGMVLQDTWIFEGTVRDNIVYSKTDVGEERIEQACKLANIDHFVHTLPHGYDTVLDDKANLSQGQKQLITIARAMIENAPMLILDEATSSVDTRTEILVQRAMDELTKGRTSFIIAHRLSTIRNADLIIVMNDGDIVETGDHDTLMAKGGFYAELYNSQFDTLSDR